MQVYCDDCEQIHDITEENLANTLPDKTGRPTVCPQCKSTWIGVIYKLKTEAGLFIQQELGHIVGR